MVSSPAAVISTTPGVIEGAIRSAHAPPVVERVVGQPCMSNSVAVPWLVCGALTLVNVRKRESRSRG